MWFKCTDYEGLYWLTDNEARETEEPPHDIPADAPLRGVTEGDWTWDYFTARTITGLIVNYRWVINEGFSEGVESKVEFPRFVTTKTLADFFAKCSPKSRSIRLDAHTNISLRDSGYTLNVNGIRVLWWGEDRVSWAFQGELKQVQIDSIQKYLGKAWKLIFKNGMACLENEAGDWVVANPWATLTTDGKILDKKNCEETHTNGWLKRYAKLNTSITQYVESVTPENVELATKGITRKTHGISTRCIECQNRNGKHLEIHMARKDLDTYLIYSVYDNFGKGNPLAETWNLIEYPTSNQIREFKLCLNNFLLDTLRTEITGPTFLPLERRPDSTQWKLAGEKRPHRFAGGALPLLDFEIRPPAVGGRMVEAARVRLRGAAEIPFPLIVGEEGDWEDGAL